MDPIRIVDIRLLDKQKTQVDIAGKPSVEDVMRHYSSGKGWEEAYEEVKRLSESGATYKYISSAVGWSEEKIREALSNGGQKPVNEPDPLPPPPRKKAPPKTIADRVASLGHIDKKILKKSKHYYEYENMTIAEISEIIEESYERTYFILIKAGTEFRRSGRRKKGF